MVHVQILGKIFKGFQKRASCPQCSSTPTSLKSRLLEARLNSYLPELKNFLVDGNLTLSAPKSTATIFTTWTREVRKVLDIKIEEQVIPTIQYPKILGVIFDNLLTFSKHVEDAVASVKSSTKSLKLLLAVTWLKSAVV